MGKEKNAYAEHDASCNIADRGATLLDVGSNHAIDIIGDVSSDEIDGCHDGCKSW